MGCKFAHRYKEQSWFVHNMPPNKIRDCVSKIYTHRLEHCIFINGMKQFVEFISPSDAANLPRATALPASVEQYIPRQKVKCPPENVMQPAERLRDGQIFGQASLSNRANP